MTKPPGQAREREYKRALRQRTRTHPQHVRPVHGPRVRPLRTGRGSTGAPVGRPRPRATRPARCRPPGGVYPDVPVLVLAGELDSVTTPAEARMVRAQFPTARLVVVRNSFHVTAIGDTDDCAVRILRAFVRSPATQPTPERQRCAGEVEPIRDARPLSRGPCPTCSRGGARRRSRVRRVGAVAAATVADLLDRWWNNYSGHGVGLRGGTWTYTGDRTVKFRLHGVRMVDDLAVSGRAVWKRYGEVANVDLTVSGAATGRLAGSWDTRAGRRHGRPHRTARREPGPAAAARAVKTGFRLRVLWGAGSHSGSDRSHDERQVASAEHDQEVRQVHQGEARREARQGPRGDLLREDRPTKKK